MSKHKLPPAVQVGKIVHISSPDADEFGGRARVESIKGSRFWTRFERKGWRDTDLLQFEVRHGKVYYVPDSNFDAFGKVEAKIR